MIKKEYSYLIEIIRNVLKGKDTEYKSDIDYNFLYEVSKFHSLDAFLYVGTKNFDLGEISTKLKKKYNEEIYKVAFQEAEKENLLNELEKNNIKHMPLKGAILKYMYPSIELRSMADFDCLFDKTKAKFVKKMMINLGYSVEQYNKGNHDVYLKKPFMNIEMHKDLMNESYKISKYYKNIWERLEHVENTKCEYRFTDEDFYVFMIAHMAKHFSHGGTGIRGFIDVYLYLKNKPNLDFNKINTELDKMGLVKFSDGVIELTKVWFDDAPSNELMDAFQENIFTNGTYGTITNSAIVQFYINEEASRNLESSKSKYLFKRLFPPFKDMKQRNPILKKAPILLPWFYMTRLFKGLFTFRKNKNEIKNVNKITEKDIEKVNNLHDELGVKNKI